MKIKRFYAQDMRQAIRDIREDQGPDAVILSTRKVDGGIEVIAALDYDESIFSEMSAPGADEAGRVEGSPVAREKPPRVEPPLHEEASREVSRPEPAQLRPQKANVKWMQDPALVEMKSEISSLRSILESRLTHLAWNDMARSQPEYAGIMHRLADMGIDTELGQEVAAQVNMEGGDLEHGWRQALGVLSHKVLVSEDDILTKGGVVALVGPTGVGKTTTIAKLAARFALRHGQHEVALISTDNYRIGAHDQLLTYGKILGVPTYAVDGQEQLIKTINDLGDKRLVLIDTAGTGQRDLRLNEQLSELMTVGDRIRSYLVLSANTQKESMDEVVSSFQRIPLAGCIITKLDEASSLGGVLSVAINHRLSVAYLSDGQRVPEDIYPARAHTLVSRAVASMRHGEQKAGLATACSRDQAAHAHA